VALEMADGGRLEARARPARRETSLRRVSADGAELWRLALPGDEDGVALARGSGRLYAALYPSGAAGCRVAAVDEARGRLLWQRPVEGPGRSLHSKYANRVELEAKEDAVVVRGRESAGAYREVLDGATGQTRSREVDGP
jgi:hypothetical protein